MAGNRLHGYKKQSQFKEVWHRLCKNKLAIVGLVLVVIIVLSAVFAPILTPYDYEGMDLRNAKQYPSSAHWLGTDQNGRDILTRVLYGGRTSLLISLVAIAISLVAGGLLGAVASYFGGMLENVIMRLLDILMAVPAILLAVAISAALGNGMINCAVAIGVSSLPTFARIIRASVLSIKNQEYIEAAKACGVRDFRIILRHVIPNSLAPIIVQTTLRVGESRAATALGRTCATTRWTASRPSAITCKTCGCGISIRCPPSPAR